MVDLGLHMCQIKIEICTSQHSYTLPDTIHYRLYTQDLVPGRTSCAGQYLGHVA